MQFTTAPGLKFQLTNYEHDYPIERDYGFLIKPDEVMDVVSSNLDLHGYKLFAFSPSFYLWSLNDALSRTYILIYLSICHKSIYYLIVTTFKDKYAIRSLDI